MFTLTTFELPAPRLCHVRTVSVRHCYGFTTDPAEWKIESEYDFLGIHFVRAKGEVCLTERIRSKVEAICCTPHSLRDLLVTVGLLVFAGRVLGIALAKRFPVFKFIRRRARQDLDAAANTWKCVPVVLREWADDILSAAPRKVFHQSHEVVTIFTDTCFKG
jgi:hypothetical protein